MQDKKRIISDNEWKQELNKCLQSLGFLCNNTEQIVVNINQGKVCDVKQTVRIK